MTTKKKPIVKKKIEYVYCLRTCKADLTAHGGFQWRKSGIINAPDWKPTNECGNGLHGLLWGTGDASQLNDDKSSKWFVVKVDKSKLIDLGGKVKFPSCEVVFCGDRRGATDLLQTLAPAGTKIHYSTATAGYRGTATAGDRGTATAGDRGTATAGDGGTATAGYRGTATAGDRGTATAGHGGTATAGDRGTATTGNGGTATAGDRGTATAGYRGTAAAGYRGTATAGYEGTATAGDDGTATAGEGGTATAGYRGVISITYYDAINCRYRRKVAEVDGIEIKPNTPYIVENGVFTPPP